MKCIICMQKLSQFWYFCSIHLVTRGGFKNIPIHVLFYFICYSSTNETYTDGAQRRRVSRYVCFAILLKLYTLHSKILVVKWNTMFAHDMGNRYVSHCRAVKARTVRNDVRLILVTTLHTSSWTMLQCISMQNLINLYRVVQELWAFSLPTTGVAVYLVPRGILSPGTWSILSP